MTTTILDDNRIATWSQDGETCWTRLSRPVAFSRHDMWPETVGSIDGKDGAPIAVTLRGYNEIGIRGYLRWAAMPFLTR